MTPCRYINYPPHTLLIRAHMRQFLDKSPLPGMLVSLSRTQSSRGECLRLNRPGSQVVAQHLSIKRPKGGSMQPKRHWLFLSIVCLVCLLGMALVAVPAQGKQFAYVANAGSSSVSVIDTSTNTVIGTVGVGGRPVGVAFTPTGSRVYVTNSDSDSVSVIDPATNTVIATIAVASFPQGIAITPDGSRAYVANTASNN